MAERKREESMIPSEYWNPFALLRELERTFENFRMGAELVPSASRMPRVDVRDEGERYVVEAELPGMSKEDVDIEVGDGYLLLKAERERSEEEKREGYLRRERGYQSFYRRISLPEDADPEGIGARLNNGVLVMTLPKREGARGRRKVNIE